MSQIYLGDKIIASTEGSDIKYDENTSVNEKIDELNSNLENNILEEAISLNSYNSETNKYTFPSDGYLVLSSNTSKNGGFKLYGSNGNESGIRIAVTCFGTDKYGGQQVIFVKKGMMGFLSSSSSTSGAEFRPLV